MNAQDWGKTRWHITDRDNTIYRNVHTDDFVAEQTVHISSKTDTTGIWHDEQNKTYYYVAIIDDPDYGDIWHVVTYVDNRHFETEEALP